MIEVVRPAARLYGSLSLPGDRHHGIDDLLAHDDAVERRVNRFCVGRGAEEVPCPVNPLTPVKSRTTSNVHNRQPLVAEKIRNLPSALPS